MAPKTKAPTKKKSGRLNLKKVEKERSQQPRQTCQEKHKAAQKETKRKEKEATEAKAKELEQKARADAASNVEKAVDWIWKQVQNEVTAGLVEFDEMLDPNVLNFYYALGITKFNIVRTTLVSAFEKSHKPGHKRSVDPCARQLAYPRCSHLGLQQPTCHNFVDTPAAASCHRAQQFCPAHRPHLFGYTDLADAAGDFRP